ncbi:MAG: hypothetical protein NC230_07025 [Bacteroides sp.]|nr:hypothetical protein [Bacteroides sp.]MCM1413873.1 hypothetical protein [Bacteroides sp.]
MEYIENYLAITVTKDTEPHISNYLRHAHYPHAIDRERMKVLVFNMPFERAMVFADKLNFSNWEYHTYPTPPEEYVNLFRFVDFHIYENLLTYRWNSLRNDKGVFSTMEERGRLFNAAFNHDGYSAWRLRYYLSKDLYGIIADTPRHHILYEEADRRMKGVEWLLEGRLAGAIKDLGMPFYKQPITLDFYFDTDRLYIGWFICDTNLLNLRGSLRFILNPITAAMNQYLKEQGITRNTHNPKEVEAFFNSQSLGAYQLPTIEQPKHPFFLNHIIIPWQNSLDEIPKSAYISNVHAIDRLRKQILVLNMSYTQLCNLAKTPHPISIRYSEGEPPLYYQDLFNKVEAQIRANMPTYDDDRLRNCMAAAMGNGMSNYITRMRLYKGLRDLNATE